MSKGGERKRILKKMRTNCPLAAQMYRETDMRHDNKYELESKETVNTKKYTLRTT